MPEQEQNREASRYVIIYMDLIFQMVKFVTPLYDVQQSRVQRTVHFVMRTTSILAIRMLIFTNRNNESLEPVLLCINLKRFQINTFTFPSDWLHFRQNFRNMLPITPYTAATSLTYLHCR